MLPRKIIHSPNFKNAPSCEQVRKRMLKNFLSETLKGTPSTRSASFF